MWHAPNDIIEERLAGRGAWHVFFGGQQADIITFDGWVNNLDANTLMQQREKKRVITLKADLIGQHFTQTSTLFGFLEDFIINEQRGINKNYPYKFRFRKVADADNWNRSIVTQTTAEVTTFGLSPKPVVAYPILDGAVVFNGTSQYSICASPTSALNMTGATTIEATVNPTNFSATQCILAKGKSDNSQINFEVDINTSGCIVFTFTVSGVSQVYTTTTQALTAAAWNTIAVTLTFSQNPSNIAVYVNGASTPATGSWTSGSGTSAPDTVSQQLVFGAAANASTKWFVGSISNVAIQNVLFSQISNTIQADATLSYYRGTPLLNSLTKGYWQMSEWVGTVNYDSSGNNNQLTMTASPTFGKGQLGVQPSQTPSGAYNAESGGLPYLANFSGNLITLNTYDYDVDLNTVQTGMTTAGEYYMKNGLVKVVTRITQSTNPGGLDFYYWSGTAYTYVGYIYHGVYATSWQYTNTQAATPTILIGDDPDYGLMQIIWNGFTDSGAVMCEYEIFRGKPFIATRLTNIGGTNLTGVNTLIGGTTSTLFYRWNSVAGVSGNDSANTQLLLHFNQSSGSTTFTDISLGANSPHTVTAGGSAQIDTTMGKFGSSLKLRSATSDYLTSASNADWQFGTGDWTIDCWVNFNSLTNAMYLCGQYVDANNYWYLYKDTNANGNKLSMKFQYSSATKGSYVMTNSWSGVATGTWYHLQFSRAASASPKGIIFINGTSQTLTESTAFASNDVGALTAALIIGAQNSGGYLDANVDEFRLSKGLARNTSNFTSPTAEYGGGTTTESSTTDTLNFDYLGSTNPIASGTVVFGVAATTKANGRSYVASVASSNYTYVGQQFYTMTTVAPGNDMERFWIFAKLMQTAAGNDDDPSQISLVCLDRIDQVSDLKQIT